MTVCVCVCKEKKTVTVKVKEVCVCVRVGVCDFNVIVHLRVHTSRSSTVQREPLSFEPDIEHDIFTHVRCRSQSVYSTFKANSSV